MIREEAFGVVGGREVHAYVLDGGAGVTARVSDHGARLVELHVPDRDGRPADVVLGFDDIESYVRHRSLFVGGTIGRYANRIRDARFRLEGAEVRLDANEGAHHLHGGGDGWDQRLWDAALTADGTGISFHLLSPDGDMGYPGACTASCTYTLVGNLLHIVMEAVPDATTVINMAHHSYFNLAGHDRGDVLGQHLCLAGDFYVPVDEELLPTGEILAVAGTRYDFRSPRPIGDAHGRADYDHTWCLRERPGTHGLAQAASTHGLAQAASAHDLRSGRRLRLWTDQPGVQMYACGHLDGLVHGKRGSTYARYAGFALETQTFPDSPNIAHFPSATVRAGRTYRHEVVMELSAD